MIQQFIVFYLVFWWVMGILYKDNLIHRKLEELGIKIGQNTKLGGLIDSLSQCKFCIENHTSTILASSYYFYCGDIKVLIFGILCTSINYWLREFIK
jgi:hypothetical protein